MKRTVCLWLLWLAMPIRGGASDLGVVSTADYLRFPVQAIDSAGLEQIPDSGHVLVWFEGEASTNAASYTDRWTAAGASGSVIDSLAYAGRVYYYYVDQVADLDNDEGVGVYTGRVVLFTDGQPYPNDFSFTVAGDELADYWAEVSRQGDSLDAFDNWIGRQTAVDDLEDTLFAVIDSLQNLDDWVARIPALWTASDSTAYQGAAAGLDSTSVARAVWNAPAANHGGSGTFGSNLDTTVSSVTIGSGAFATTLVACDTSCHQTIGGVKLAVRNLDQTSLVALVATGISGTAEVNLDPGDYLVSAAAPGYLFDAYDTVTIAGAQLDSICGARFDPGAPVSPSLCRVYGYLYNTEGQAEAAARVSAYLPGGVAQYVGLIVSPAPTSTSTDANGFFYLDLIPTALLVGAPRYEFTISRTDGTILRKRLSVPSVTNWQLTW